MMTMYVVCLSVYDSKIGEVKPLLFQQLGVTALLFTPNSFNICKDI